MKIPYLIFVLLFPIFLQGQDIDVPETNHPLITKRTATWCPNCGSYGWTLFRDLLADHQSSALVLAAHFGSSALTNEVSNELTTALGGFGQPVFFLNEENLGANSGNIGAVRQDAAAQVAAINEVPPVAQTGILAQASMDSLIVQTKTRFFGDLDGESVNLAIYLIEPTVIAIQSGQGAMAEHKNILRYSMTGTAFGETIVQGGAVAGSEIERRYSMAIADLEANDINTSSLGNGSLIVAAVLWQGTPGNFEVLNTHQVRESMLTNLSSLEANVGLRVFPLPAASEATVALSLEQALPDAELNLVNASGQQIRTVHAGVLPAGEHSFTVPKGQLPAGQYWLQLTDGARTLSRSLLFR